MTFFLFHWENKKQSEENFYKCQPHLTTQLHLTPHILPLSIYWRWIVSASHCKLCALSSSLFSSSPSLNLLSSVSIFFFLFYWTISISTLLFLPSLQKKQNIIKPLSALYSSLTAAIFLHSSLLKNASKIVHFIHHLFFSSSHFLLNLLHSNFHHCHSMKHLFSKYPIHKFSVLSYSTNL